MTNDIISRSALLATYDAAHKGPPGAARKLIEEAPSITPSVPEHMDAFEEAYCNGYEAAKRESRWIYVDDAIPENSRLVLGLMLGKHCFVGGYSAFNLRWYVADQVRSSPCKYKVTHWMELPKPPEVEE